MARNHRHVYRRSKKVKSAVHSKPKARTWGKGRHGLYPYGGTHFHQPREGRRHTSASAVDPTAHQNLRPRGPPERSCNPHERGGPGGKWGASPLHILFAAIEARGRPAGRGGRTASAAARRSRKVTRRRGDAQGHSAVIPQARTAAETSCSRRLLEDTEAAPVHDHAAFIGSKSRLKAAHPATVKAAMPYH